MNLRRKADLDAEGKYILIICFLDNIFENCDTTCTNCQEGRTKLYSRIALVSPIVSLQELRIKESFSPKRASEYYRALI